jgi:hypothetical protein
VASTVHCEGTRRAGGVAPRPPGRFGGLRSWDWTQAIGGLFGSRIGSLGLLMFGPDEAAEQLSEVIAGVERGELEVLMRGLVESTPDAILIVDDVHRIAAGERGGWGDLRVQFGRAARDACGNACAGALESAARSADRPGSDMSRESVRWGPGWTCGRFARMAASLTLTSAFVRFKGARGWSSRRSCATSPIYVACRPRAAG